ncbi:hypothetical protein [Kitasatospora sp. NPDC015120]|uniref:hypothetical protein n=1 Tax=Kitasatospora sp. NPDC015120 TaxID=3364023 RepID=UPI0036F46B6C
MPLCRWDRRVLLGPDVLGRAHADAPVDARSPRSAWPCRWSCPDTGPASPGPVLSVLRGSGELPTGFGALVVATGAVGGFGPVLAVAVLLSGDTPARTAVVRRPSR